MSTDHRTESRDPGPLVRKTAERLMRQIRRQHRPGDRLATIAAMAKRLGVSLGTMHKAVSLLVGQGWLSARPRAGTFVAAGPKHLSRVIGLRTTIPIAAFAEAEFYREFFLGFCTRAMSHGMDARLLPGPRGREDALAHWEDLGGLITQDIWDPAPLLPPAGQMPVVMLQIDSAPPEIGTVSFNYETAVFEVMRHLADLGHRRVAFIGLSNLSDEPELRCPRYEAFVQAVKQLALEYDPRWSTDVRRAPQAREAMVRLLSAPPSRRPTAVLARDMVWPLLCEMARYRLVPGRDVSVVSLAHAEPWPRWLRCSRQLGDRMPWLYGQSDWLADLPDVAGEVVRYVPSVVASDARALGEAAVDEVHRRCQDFTRPPCRRRVGVAYHGGNTVGPPRPA